MIRSLDFENLFLRSKVAIPFVEANSFLPEKIFCTKRASCDIIAEKFFGSQVTK